MSVYAQEYGYFFNSSSGDRTYNAESFETWLKPFFVSGVFTGCLQVKALTTPGMAVKVLSGYANLDGKAAYWPNDNTINLDPASGVYDRIDTIVLRRDNTNRQVSIEYVKGTASIDPQPVAPERTSDIFELVLAEILVGTGVTEVTQSVITDKRPDTDVCGYVVAAVQTPDFSELYDQFAAQAEEFMGDQAADFLAWFDEMKDQLSEDAAGHLQLEIDAINDTLGNVPEDKTLQDQIDAAVDEIGQISDALCYVVNGNKSIESVTIPVGALFRLANSEIVGRSDGVYTAKIAIPVDTVIDSTYFNEASPVSGGVGNLLNSNIESIGTWESTGIGIDYTTFYKNNKIKLVHANIIATPNGPTKSWTLGSTIPKPKYSCEFPVYGYDTGNNLQGYGYISIGTDGSVTFKGSAGFTYLRGNIVYPYA